MEETKPATDTPDYSVEQNSGREASCADRSLGVSSSRPRRIENPAESSSIAGRESQSPKGCGFASNGYQLAVSRS